MTNAGTPEAYEASPGDDLPLVTAPVTPDFDLELPRWRPSDPFAEAEAEAAAAEREPPALSERLTALARLVQIGSARRGVEGFNPSLLNDAEDLLARAGERMRLAADATIAVIAGGTGSGKSSLFNVIAGARFSPVGVVRPVTREPYACTWGAGGEGPLMDWLAIQPRRRFARSSELDSGERSLAGLVLVDMPDHDSVLTNASSEVERLVELADLMVWVVDPQKYADAAMHERFLKPLASHSSMIAVVLNQADLLTPAHRDDCRADLRRLLDAEGLHAAQVTVTSATTGEGIRDLRDLLAEAVATRQASLSRIAAHVDSAARRFTVYAGGADTAAASKRAERWMLSGSVETSLTGAFSQAAGVAGIGRALESARGLRAADYLGWPLRWLTDRVLRRHLVRDNQVSAFWNEVRDAPAASAGARQSEIDAAITRLGAEVGRDLPAPWSETVRKAARARSGEIPGAVGAAVAAALPDRDHIPGWWRLMAAGQGILLGAVVAAAVWLGALVVGGLLGRIPATSSLLVDTSLLPWVALMLAATLGLGWITARVCVARAVRLAATEREQAEWRMRAEIGEVAREMVIVPVITELSEYDRFRSELATARGQR